MYYISQYGLGTGNYAKTLCAGSGCVRLSIYYAFKGDVLERILSVSIILKARNELIYEQKAR